MAVPSGAQAPPPKPDNAESDSSDDEGTKKARTDEADVVSAARRHQALIAKLRERMDEKLDLSNEQERAVDALFQTHMKELKNAKGQRRATKEAEKRDDELAELRGKLREARAGGNKEDVNEIRKQMRDILKEQRQGVTKGTAEFLRKVRDELDDEQTKEYEEIVRELGLDLEDNSGITVQQLFKVVLSPEIGLSEEQRKAVLDRMRGALLGMDTDAKDAGDLGDISSQLRAEVRSDLTPAQWTKVEEMIKADAAAAKAASGEKKPGKSDAPSKP
jgi:hypothetical protein